MAEMTTMERELAKMVSDLSGTIPMHEIAKALVTAGVGLWMMEHGEAHAAEQLEQAAAKLRRHQAEPVIRH